MRLFNTLPLCVALVSLLASAAHADTKIVNFSVTPFNEEVEAPFDGFTVWGSKGVAPLTVTSTLSAGIGVNGTTGTAALDANEVVTFEFAPVPARRVVLTSYVVTPGYVHVRVRTTAGLQPYFMAIDASEPIDTDLLAAGQSIVSIAVEAATAVLYIRKIEHDAQRFAPGDRLRFDNFGDDPYVKDRAHFYGVAGMTLELERIGGTPTTQGLVTIRRDGEVEEARIVMKGNGKGSLKLLANGWFEWTYQSADGIQQEIEIQTRAVFKKKDAKVVYQSLDDEFHVPSLAGMILEASVTAPGGAHTFTFEAYEAGAQWNALGPITAAKKGVLKIAPFTVETAGVLVLDVDGPNLGQMVTITFTRTAPAFDKSTAPIVDIDS